VNDDFEVDAIDAALIFQYISDLIDDLPNLASADVNRNDRVNAIDGQLILQYEAGLIDELPPDITANNPARLIAW
jgi:hypothetical protein